MNTYNIAIISSSIREGRKSNRVALFLHNFLKSQYGIIANKIDLKEYAFPIFEERLIYQTHHDAKTQDFAKKIKDAEGIIFIVPEYNGSYPASLKNAIDLLVNEWYHKPVALVGVSAGTFGGIQVIGALQSLLWKLKAWTVPGFLSISLVDTAFDEQGTPSSKEEMEKRTAQFLKELFWSIDLLKK